MKPCRLEGLPKPTPARENVMTGIRIQLGAITAAFVALAYAMPSPAAAVSASLQVIADATDFSARARGGGGARAGGARVGGGGRSVNVNRNVNRNVNVRRTN